MARPRITPEERATVRQFVLGIYERWAAGTDQAPNYTTFAKAAGIDSGNFSVWRAGPEAKKKATPEALDILRMLRAIGVLGPNFELPGEPNAPAAAADQAANLGESVGDRAEQLPRVQDREETG